MGRGAVDGFGRPQIQIGFLKEDSVKRALVAATGIAALVAGTAALAGTSSASGSGDKVIALTGHQTSQHIVDNGHKGDSVGDFGVIVGKLSRHGKHVGRYQAYCVQIDANGHSQCTFTLALPGGQIVLETGYGPGINGNKTVHEAIVGGTGKYAGAHGYTSGQETGRTTIKEVLYLQN
jgi:hypothetical protein